MSRSDDISRIRTALEAAADLVGTFDLRRVAISHRENGDPTTALDRAINQILLETLRADGDGWLSEDNEDDLSRLHASRVWIVDPIDGTREFVSGIPEWCVSVGLIENQRAVAGGILNPNTREMFLGSLEDGLQIYNSAQPDFAANEAPPCLLVSRREHKDGSWDRFKGADFDIKPVGSIAYRLALVASGCAAATGTFEPRNEWDLAAGVALMHATCGQVEMPSRSGGMFNQPSHIVTGCFAFSKDCPSSLKRQLRVNENETTMLELSCCSASRVGARKDA